jgi:hypothetical protein
MSLNENEQLLVEAINSYLQQDDKLGLAHHDKDPYNQMFKDERGLEYMHNNINDMFHLKSAELSHTEALNQSFGKVHSYKYLDDPTFKTAMTKEMVAQGVPAVIRDKALKIVDGIIEELSEDASEWAEKDSGFNPNMDDIVDVSNPDTSGGEFEIQDDDGYNDANVESEIGDASMGRMPDSSDIELPK